MITGSLLEGLNDAQRQAVTATEGFVRVIAGAGSGKTRAISRRFAWLVNELGILPGNILCVTFTNKSAGEMRRRIHSLIGDNDTAFINTFHGFCLAVLHEESHAVQYPRSFPVLDNADIDAMLETIYQERGLTLRHMTFAAARDMIEIRKIFTEPDYCLHLTALSPAPLKQKYDEAVEVSDIIFYGYLYQEKKCFGMDYNDLIKLTLHVFHEDEAICRKWQSRLEYIMVDEFQDIDTLQHSLMSILCGCHKNLFVVGDPDQTIYTWRGANVSRLMDFDADFPGTRTIMMMKNYRSTPQILAAANSLIAKNTMRVEKELIPTLPDGPPVLCCMARTQQDEAAWIVGEIRRLRDLGADWRDMAVLYRAHSVTRPLETVLIRENIPYVIHSGVPFYSRREVRDALAYLRMISFRDDLSFARIVNVPRRNIGERRMRLLRDCAAANGCTLYEALRRLAEGEAFRGSQAGRFIDLIEAFSTMGMGDGKSVSELLTEVLDASGYEAMLRTQGAQDRLDNLAELKQAILDYEQTCGEEIALPDYLAWVALMTGADDQDAEGRVKLMTVHAAKGLEFPWVFLCSMNEGVFPSRRIMTLEGREEERRLAFVAMTRAERGLFLSCAGGKHFDGAPRHPSRFLLDIDPGLIQQVRPVDEKALEEARQAAAFSGRWLLRGAEATRFAAGQRVIHKAFGPGVILEVDRDRSAYLVRFDGLPTPRAISFRAGLEPPV